MAGLIFGCGLYMYIITMGNRYLHRKAVVSRSAVNPLYVPTTLSKLSQDTPAEPSNPKLAPEYEEIREFYTLQGTTSCKETTAGNPHGNTVVYDTVGGSS